MKGKLYIFLLIFLVVLCIIVSCSVDDSRFEQLERHSTAELNEKGIRALGNNKTDSALFYFTLSAGKFSDNLSELEKKECADAFNNAGYVSDASDDSILSDQKF